jgi:TrmH family RNA methyltransferase
MALTISSLQNPRVKQVVKLQNRRVRDAEQVTVVEGVREFELATANGHKPQTAYICPELLQAAAPGLAARLQAQTDFPLFAVTPAVYAKMAYRGEHGGVLGLFPYLNRPLDQLPLSAVPFLVVIEGGEKPGNVGAILRTADAAGVDGLIIAATADRPGTDMHNPNVVRASLGAVFTVPFAVAETMEVARWLAAQGIMRVAAVPEGAARYTAVDLRSGVALILGSEAFGLSPAWQEAADQRLFIPMVGQVDSLNLSVAAALFIYEVVRQRSVVNSTLPA